MFPAEYDTSHALKRELHRLESKSKGRGGRY